MQKKVSTTEIICYKDYGYIVLLMNFLLRNLRGF